MTAFVWAIAILWGIESFLKLFCLATGSIPKRTPGTFAFDTGLGFVIVIWAAVHVDSIKRYAGAL